MAASIASAQRLSVEGFAGLANYQGDLQESRYTLSQAKPGLAIGLGYALTSRISLRGLATLASIQASDRYNTRTDLQERNLNFSSRIYDASLVGIYHLFDLTEKRFTPYVFAGVSVFHFNPYTRDSAGKVFLRDLSTEGQGLSQYPDRKQYQLNQFSIPFGAGIKMVVNDKVTIGWEFRFHKTFTDYLDDVSTTYVDYNTLVAARGQRAADLAFRTDDINRTAVYPADGVVRGGSQYKDWFYFSGITASFRINTSSNEGTGSFLRKRSGVGCPKIN